MQGMKFTVPGAPIALQRARAGRYGFYDPQKHIKNAMSIYLSQYNGPLLEGPQFLYVLFHMPIAKTASKKTIQELLGTLHPLRPDADNLLKWIGDFCQSSGNIFKDDCILSAGLFFKVWELNTHARTTFEFVSLKGKRVKQNLPSSQELISLFME